MVDHEPEMTWEEFQDAVRDGINQGIVIAVLEPGGREILYVHCEHASTQQLKDRLTLEEVETFWSRHIYTPKS